MNRFASLALGSILGSILVVACTSIPRHPRVEGLDEHFSGELALAHVELLGELTPRLPDTRDDRRARGYISRELRLAGLSVEQIGDADGRHLVAELTGRSADGLLLVAPYSALGGLAPVDDSGAAVLLELARVFGLVPELPYSLRFAFCEVRPERGGGSLDDAAPGKRRLAGQGDARDRVVVGGRSLARALDERGELARLRGVVVFERVGAPDLRLARDLRSHAVFRGLFWEAASSLGFEAIFPGDGGWASANGLDLGFREQSMDRVVALVDEALARPDLDRLRPPDAVSAEILEAVGVVSFEALGRIMQRLAKIDAFSP